MTLDHPASAQVAAPPRTTTPKPEVMSEAAALLASRADTGAARASREAVRPPLLSVQRADKAASLPPQRQDLGGALTKSVAPPPPPTPREIAASLLGSYGWDSSQFSCLDSLWVRESGWNPYAQNSSSGAYGIPQALPGSKMASAGSDWATNPATQIKWGLSYIRASYGSPCGAWSHSESYGWY
jgi:transglycosylase-like protein with SLT domain